MNIQSVLNWLEKNKHQSLTLIPAGEKVFADRKSHEDMYCAYAIKNALEKQQLNINYYVNKAREFVSVKYYPFMKNMEAKVLPE